MVEIFGIGERVRKARIRRGMSQMDLARVTSIHNVGISRIELGKQQPLLETVVTLADALHCSVDYLLGRASK